MRDTLEYVVLESIRAAVVNAAALPAAVGAPAVVAPLPPSRSQCSPAPALILLRNNYKSKTILFFFNLSLKQNLRGLIISVESNRPVSLTNGCLSSTCSSSAR